MSVAGTVLGTIGFCHLLNDMMQSVLLSIYPLLKDKLALDFVHIGIITLVFQLTASVLQPVIGLYTDKHPKPFSLPFGMASTFLGMLVLALAGGFTTVLLAAALIGVGSSVFHPEASRVARLAAGGRYGFAQSVFQVGGNAGQAIGPLLVALVGSGMQVIIASHDYLLTNRLSTLAEYGKLPAGVQMRFFALGRKGDLASPVEVESGDTLADISNNAILDELARLYDDEHELALGEK